MLVGDLLGDARVDGRVFVVHLDVVHGLLEEHALHLEGQQLLHVLAEDLQRLRRRHLLND